MKEPLNRREFIRKSSVAGLTGCAVLMAAQINPLKAFDHLAQSENKIDPKALNYCGYSCPSDCKFLQATKENSVDLKKEAYEMWHLKERYNVDFDAEKVFCWGCKVEDTKLGAVSGNCTVRKCAIEKNHDACIQCDNLKTCDKDLWKRFPDFHKAIIGMQEEYQKA